MIGEFGARSATSDRGLMFVVILVVFTPLLLLAATEKCSVAGTVVDSITGVPVNKAILRLETADGQLVGEATRTDERGHFSFIELASGKYRLQAKRTGYLNMSYGARRANYNGTVLVLESGNDLTGLHFQLIPASIIAGTIRDSDGEPVEGVQVTLGRFTYEYGKGRIEGLDSSETDDRGEYRFRGLGGGKYYISAALKDAGLASAATIYPGVRDVNSASPINVAAGQSFTGVDITLLRFPVFRVSGRVIDAPAGTSVTLRDIRNAGMNDQQLRASANASGAFVFRAVPAGTYELIARNQHLRGSATVEVASELKGIQVQLALGAEVTLRVSVEGGKKVDLRGLGYFLTQDGRSGFTDLPNQPGLFAVRTVPPGIYTLNLYGPVLRTFYVKSATAASMDVLANGLTIAGAESIAVEIVLASDGGRVSGSVNKEQSHFGATVLLMPKGAVRPDWVKTTTTDQNGRFEIGAIAPGEYQVFALQHTEPDLWNDPDFVSKHQKFGRSVVVTPNAAEHVDVTVAPSDP